MKHIWCSGAVCYRCFSTIGFFNCSTRIFNEKRIYPTKGKERKFKILCGKGWTRPKIVFVDVIFSAFNWIWMCTVYIWIYLKKWQYFSCSYLHVKGVCSFLCFCWSYWRSDILNKISIINDKAISEMIKLHMSGWHFPWQEAPVRLFTYTSVSIFFLMDNRSMTTLDFTC